MNDPSTNEAILTLRLTLGVTCHVACDNVVALSWHVQRAGVEIRCMWTGVEIRNVRRRQARVLRQPALPVVSSAQRGHAESCRRWHSPVPTCPRPHRRPSYQRCDSLAAACRLVHSSRPSNDRSVLSMSHAVLQTRADTCWQLGAGSCADRCVFHGCCGAWVNCKKAKTSHHNSRVAKNTALIRPTTPVRARSS
jgi:hypothetical protein